MKIEARNRKLSDAVAFLEEFKRANDFDRVARQAIVLERTDLTEAEAEEAKSRIVARMNVDLVTYLLRRTADRLV